MCTRARLRRKLRKVLGLGVEEVEGLQGKLRFHRQLLLLGDMAFKPDFWLGHPKTSAAPPKSTFVALQWFLHSVDRFGESRLRMFLGILDAKGFDPVFQCKSGEMCCYSAWKKRTRGCYGKLQFPKHFHHCPHKKSMSRNCALGKTAMNAGLVDRVLCLECVRSIAEQESYLQLLRAGIANDSPLMINVAVVCACVVEKLHEIAEMGMSKDMSA